MGYLDSLERIVVSQRDLEITDDDVRVFIEQELKIIDKDSNRVIPFHFNAIQDRYWQEKTASDYILKYRKGGFSTLTMAEYFARAVLLDNQQVVFLAHREESTHLIFQTMHRFYQNLSPALKERLNPGRKNAQVRAKNELRFAGNGSQIIAMSGASPDALRGLTPTMCHISELAFWKPEWVEESVSSILGALPPRGLIRIETTPSGAGSYAYEEWHRSIEGDSRFQALFYAWWDDPTNTIREDVSYEDIFPLNEEEERLMVRHSLTPAQLAWRRERRREQQKKFKREYPEDSETCWSRSGSTVFDMEQVAFAFGGHEPNTDQEPGMHVFVEPQPGHTYVIGVDPAGGNENGDFSAMVGMDEETGEEVFEYYDRIPIANFGELAHEWGMRYGEACLAIERNNHGHAIIQYLTLTHPYSYLYEDDDGHFGLLTTTKSKTWMISKLDEFLWDNDLRLHGRALYRQLASYVYDDRQKAEASGKGHDDLVSALLCASFAMSRNHPKSKAAIEPTPAAPRINAPRIDDAQANDWAMAGFHAQLGFDVPSGSLPKIACNACGYPHARLVGSTWTCEKCGERMSDYATSPIFQ